MMLYSVSWRTAVCIALCLVGGARTSPVEVLVGKPIDDLAYRDALVVANHPQLEKRLSADFDMGRTWNNDILFKGCVA
jgi:hypothetical protein